MNWSNILSTSVSGATFASYIATLLTVLEMRKQRKESYKPIIIPIGKYYSLKSYQDGRYQGYTQAGGTYEPNLFIELTNAGLGPAINIEGKWDFDFKEFINKNEWPEISITFQNNEFSVIASNFSCKNYVEIQEPIKIDCLLANDKNSMRLLLPNYYITIIKLVADKRNKHLSFHMPPLMFKYEYQDVGKTKYTANYKIKLEEVFQLNIPIEPLLEYNEHGKINLLRI